MQRAGLADKQTMRSIFQTMHRVLGGPVSKYGLLSGVVLIMAGVLFLVAADVYVAASSDGCIYRSIEEVPYRRAGLLLGCRKHTQGRPNLYYQYRIDAAVQLWQAGKIDAIVVSGDNSRKDYDEPTAMKADLVARGVPADYITLDYAGFRTLDSVVRAERIFGLQDYTIISQPFHCRRAVYLAHCSHQSPIGYCARDVSGTSGFKVRCREVLARAKALVDVCLGKSPRFLGKEETVCYRGSETMGFGKKLTDIPETGRFALMSIRLNCGPSWGCKGACLGKSQRRDIKKGIRWEEGFAPSGLHALEPFCRLFHWWERIPFSLPHFSKSHSTVSNFTRL